MGDINQLLVVQHNADLVRGPILEVGARTTGRPRIFDRTFRTAHTWARTSAKEREWTWCWT